MSSQPENDLLFKRVGLFARASIFAAALIMVFAIVHSALGVRSSKTYAALGEIGSVEVREVVAFVMSFVSDGVASALYLIGIAVLALLIVRVVTGGAKRTWAPELDKDFIRQAKVLSTVAIVYALVFAVIAGKGVLDRAYLAAHELGSYFAGDALSKQLSQPLARTSALMGGLLRVLTTFFILVLGAHMIRILLLLTPDKPAGTADKPAEAGK